MTSPACQILTDIPDRYTFGVREIRSKARHISSFYVCLRNQVSNFMGLTREVDSNNTCGYNSLMQFHIPYNQAALQSHATLQVSC